MLESRCCDCANQGTEIRYWCQHSGGLVPIKCAEFLPKEKDVICKDCEQFARRKGYGTGWCSIDQKCVGMFAICTGELLDEWISVKDELPDRYAIVNAKTMLNGKRRVYWDKDGWRIAGSALRYTVNYWQPLPEKPKRHKHCYNCGEVPKDGKCCSLIDKCVHDLDACWKQKKPKEEKQTFKYCTDGNCHSLLYGCSQFTFDCIDGDDAKWLAGWLNDLSARDKKG